MTGAFVVRNQIRLPASVPEAFAFIQDPRSMLNLPDCVAAAGEVGPHGRGTLRYASTDYESLIEWSVETWEPPHLAVLRQRIQTTGTRRPPVIEARETNAFYEAGQQECLLLRETRFEIPDLRLGPLRRSAYVRAYTKTTQESLARLASSLLARGTGENDSIERPPS